MNIYIKVEENRLEEYFKGEALVSLEEILEKLDELNYENKRLEEKIEDLREDIKTNYEPIPVNEQVGVYDKDFI